MVSTALVLSFLLRCSDPSCWPKCGSRASDWISFTVCSDAKRSKYKYIYIYRVRKDSDFFSQSFVLGMRLECSTQCLAAGCSTSLLPSH